MRPGREYGHIRIPSVDEIREYANRHRISLSDQEANELIPIMEQTMSQFDIIDELPEPAPVPLKYTRRDPGRTPTAEEDPFNALIRVCHVEGAATGVLENTTAVVKDGIAVAGVPMTNGSRMLPVFTPTEDAVAVERILDAGATIVGKSNMENMGWGSGQASAFGPALNPLDPRFSTGGSSTGSAAAVAGGHVDFALGADEAGSIRVPAAMCGLVGMKATHGLVPSYGMTYFDHTMDHIGPITREIDLNARVLQAISGGDSRDPQWKRFEPRTFTPIGIDDGVSGMTFFVVEEAIAWSSPDVREAFDQGCEYLRSVGASVETVSIPLWSAAWQIESALLTFSMRTMLESGGSGYFHLGRVDPQAVATMNSQVRNTARDLPVLLQINLLAAEHMRDNYLGIHFAKAQNLRHELTRQLDERLQEGILLTPTTPNVATELAAERHTLPEIIARVAGDTILNTCPMDLSGHPALSVPTGTGRDGMPVGMQFVGAYFAESSLYQAGQALLSGLPR